MILKLIAKAKATVANKLENAQILEMDELFLYCSVACC